MSRYIKVDDIRDAIIDLNDKVRLDRRMLLPVLKAIVGLPTIEVGEDCISRAEMLDTYAELYDVFDDYPNIIEELHKVYDKLNGLSNAISRAEGEWEVEERDSYFGKKIVLTCSECGDVFSVTESEYPNERYCRYCGAKMKG